MNDKIAKERVRVLSLSSTPKPGQIWQHYKGERYMINGIVCLEKTDEIAVQYTCVGENPVPLISTLEDWHSMAIIAGLAAPRFKLVA